MREIGLVFALLLLAYGFYRLLADQRLAASRKAATTSKKEPAKIEGGSTPRAGNAEPKTSKEDAAPEGGRASKPAAVAGAGAGAKAPGTTSKPAPTPAAKPAPKPAPQVATASKPLPKMTEHDPDEDITIITLAPSAEMVAAMNAVAAKTSSGAAKPPRLETGSEAEDDAEDEQEELDEVPSAVPIVYDEDAAIDEPTRVSALILVSAASQTDQGRRRRRNEDSMIVLDDHHLFVVADGMGGHAGGDVASKMAVETIGMAFRKTAFAGDPYPDVPRRGSELVMAIQMANKAIFEHARANAAYQGMGTTVVSARFSPNKQRVYFGHVGDSRCYRLRGTHFTQITTDHTMASQGVTGPLASHLNRAVGVGPGVKVDLIIARPRPEDVYLLCTDGLSKMVPDDQIQAILLEEKDLEKAVHSLVERANARGGRDNITVILVQVKDAQGFAKLLEEKKAAIASS